MAVELFSRRVSTVDRSSTSTPTIEQNRLKIRAERIAPSDPLPTGKRGGKPRLASLIVRYF